MKQITLCIVLALFAFGLLAPGAHAANWTADMKEGKPAFKSMGPLAFGPNGILFVADTKSAAITAIATGDTMPAMGDKLLKVEGINQKIAGLLGTTAKQILIDDMAVNPISHQAYLAVSRGTGPDAIAVLVRVKADGQPEAVSLDKVKFSRVELPDAPVEGGSFTTASVGSAIHAACQAVQKEVLRLAQKAPRSPFAGASCELRDARL